MSSRNPFRSPAQSPNPTGASAVSSAPSYTTLPFPLAPVPTGAPSASNPPPSYSAISERDPHSDDEESPEALPELTPRIPSARPPVTGTGGRPSPPRSESQNRPPTTAPPPFPPRRPSSRTTGPSPPASAPPVPEDILSTDSLPETAPPPAYSVTPDVSGGELIVQQGPRRPFQRAPEPFLQFPAPEIGQQEPEQDPNRLQTPRPRPPRFAPPPGVPNPTSERPHSQLSDFAQDFYNAGTATPPSEGQQQRRQRQPSQPRYAPPPGAPPPPLPRPRAASTSSGAGSTAPPTSDGRPTTTPTPGHPLLRNGQTLVYPETYYCQKCHNTGYKNYDPSHPCRKCWDRFGKPFTSILSSSPWGSESSGSASQSQRGRSFQRPLPAFKPPQARAPPPPSMPGAYPLPPGPPGLRRCNSRPMAMPYGTVPPPGATVVMPGDPRIGGRLCWRCGGRGTTPFLIFDELTCETCGGIGRLVN